jgi:hypothetical protein
LAFMNKKTLGFKAEGTCIDKSFDPYAGIVQIKFKGYDLRFVFEANHSGLSKHYDINLRWTINPMYYRIWRKNYRIIRGD